MKYKIIIILISVILLNSIQSSRELNDLTIVSSVGIEKKEDEYLVTALITTPEKSESGASSSSSEKKVMYHSSAKTIHDALRKMTVESPNKLYLAHLKLLLISEDIARENLKDAFDFFVRDTETSNDFIFLVSKNSSPQDVLSLVIPNEENLTENIIDSVEASAKYLGYCNENTLNQTLDTILTGGEQVVMPSVEIVKESSNKNNEEKKNNNENSLGLTTSSEKNQDENEKKDSDQNTANEEIKGKVKIDKMAYFKDSKLIGYLTDEESMVCNLIRNKINNTILEVNEEYKFAVEIVKIKVDLKPTYENNEYVVNITVKCSCNITEIKENYPAITKENVAKYQECIEKKMKEQMYNYIYKCQNEYKTDILGYEKLYKKKLNKEYKKIEKNFENEIFPKIKTNIDIHAQISNYGGIRKEW